MTFDRRLPERSHIVTYGASTELRMQVESHPLEIPRAELTSDLRHTRCWEMWVRYLDDHPTGALHSRHSLIVREDELHLWRRVG